LTQRLDIVHVPFNGSGPAIASALAGHTPIAFTVLTPAMPQVREGRLRALAVTTRSRSPVLPEVPTLTEAGLPDQEADTMLGLLAPAGTPQAIVELLYREVGNAMRQSVVREKLGALGLEAIISSPDVFAARIKVEIPKWAEVIREANIKPQQALTCSRPIDRQEASHGGCLPRPPSRGSVPVRGPQRAIFAGPSPSRPTTIFAYRL
jgi:tripartite-type tricarboxylate transporter receptor subunit TctC